MRLPRYLSPSSIHLWQKDEEEFYKKYLSDVPYPKQPSCNYFALGSGFDAFVKAYIHKAVFGNEGEYGKRKLFEEQVDKDFWDSAWVDSTLVFEAYKKAGCLADLFLDLKQAISPPNFEFTLNSEVNGIPLLGKPDMFYLSKTGHKVVTDWKVTGMYGKSLKSPCKGYIKFRESGKLDKAHKNAVVVEHCGTAINAAIYLEEASKDYADQLAVYSWLLGEPVGSENWVARIDQCTGPLSRLRFATHCCRVSEGWGRGFFDVAKNLWEIIQSGWIFRNMDESESRALQGLLDSESNGDTNEYGF